MLLIERRIWSAQAATANTEFNSVTPELTKVLSYILTFAGTSFSGTIDIQGREDANDSWANIAYRAIDAGGGAGPLTQDALTFATFSDRVRYLVPLSPVFVRFSMTRTAGSIDAWVRGSATPIILPTSASSADYYRLSTELRPGNPYSDPDTVIAVGAKLLEYDTGRILVYAGSQRGWVSVDAPSIENLLEQILHELTLIKFSQELVLDESIS